MSNVTILLVPYYMSYSVEGRPYCLNYMNSGGELASTRFTYDGRGRNDQAFYQQITGRRSSRNQHQFDAEGRLIRKDRLYNDEETSVELFTYDTDGRLVSESFESSSGAKGTARYAYNDSGHAIRMVCDGYKGWFKGEIEFEVDSHGKRTAGRIFQDGQEAGKIEYQYDIHGNLLHEYWEIGSWNQTLRYSYEDVSA